MDFSMSKLLLAAIVALVVLGPEKLPGAARYAGRIIRRALELRNQLMSEAIKVHKPLIQLAKDFNEGAQNITRISEEERHDPAGSMMDFKHHYRFHRKVSIQLKSRAAKSKKAQGVTLKSRALTARMRPGHKYS